MWYDFGSVRSLDFDERYRFAQLPLLAPNHPLAINKPAGEGYGCGRYATPKYSLALPIPHSELERSNAYQALLRDLQSRAPRGCWLDRIHRAFGHDPASFHGMGNFNFVDELDENESRDLADFIGTWKHVTMFEGVARRLQIMATNDDLALSARTISIFPS